jgi:hypothetical protein
MIHFLVDNTHNFCLERLDYLWGEVDDYLFEDFSQFDMFDKYGKKMSDVAPNISWWTDFFYQGLSA